MSDTYGTAKGAPVDAALLERFVQDFERDWADDEVVFSHTTHSKVLSALETLGLSTPQIEAFERKAREQEQPFELYMLRVLQGELLSA